MSQERALNLADAENDLRIVELGLAGLKTRLASVRYQTGPVLVSVALANGADPDAGHAAELRAIAASCCDGIEYAISEAEKHARIVRDHFDAHVATRAQPPPPDIDASWQRFVSAFDHARRELDQMTALL
jgi:hypothetical protein